MLNLVTRPLRTCTLLRGCTILSPLGTGVVKLVPYHIEHTFNFNECLDLGIIKAVSSVNIPPPKIGIGIVEQTGLQVMNISKHRYGYEQTTLRLFN